MTSKGQSYDILVLGSGSTKNSSQKQESKKRLWFPGNK